MNIPTRNNKKLEQVLEKVNSHQELQAILEASNTMAVKRLGMSDHGKTHVAIVANVAVKILRQLIQANITPSIVKDWEYTTDDAEVVVFLASIMHDLGNSVHRDLHDDIGIVLANKLLHDILEGAYDTYKKQVIITETLHAMVAHDTKVAVHTVEAGVVRIADGLDMKKGRARIGFEQGKTDIHSVSAMAIEDVQVHKEEKPICIDIMMSDAAGIFQVDYLLKKKIKGSGLEKFVQVQAKMTDKEEKIIETYTMT